MLYADGRRESLAEIDVADYGVAFAVEATPVPAVFTPPPAKTATVMNDDAPPPPNDYRHNGDAGAAIPIGVVRRRRPRSTRQTGVEFSVELIEGVRRGVPPAAGTSAAVITLNVVLYESERCAASGSGGGGSGDNDDYSQPLSAPMPPLSVATVELLSLKPMLPTTGVRMSSQRQKQQQQQQVQQRRNAWRSYYGW